MSQDLGPKDPTAVPRMRPELPHVVIDQNRMRIGDDGIDHIAPLLDRARLGDLSLLVPDVAMVEMTQHPTAWESTLAQSLRLFAHFPEGVVLARAVSEIMRKELESGLPVSTLVDDALSTSFHDLLREVGSGSGPTLDYMRARITDARRSAERDFYDHDRNKARAMELDAGWKQVLSPKGRGALRHGDPNLLRCVALDAVERFGVQALLRCGASVKTAQVLLSTPSMSLAVVAAPFVAGLLWQQDGGFPTSRRAKDASNDGIDLDYARLAVFTNGVVSRDDRLLRLTEHLGAVMDMRVHAAVHGLSELHLPIAGNRAARRSRRRKV